MINYYQQKEKLPESLKDLNNPISGSYIPVEPEFEKPIHEGRLLIISHYLCQKAGKNIIMVKAESFL